MPIRTLLKPGGLRTWFGLRTAAALLLPCSILGCSSSHLARSDAPARTPPGSAPTSASPSSTPAPRSPATVSAVGFRKVVVVDRAAGTPQRGATPARRDRILPTFVWYPAVGSGAARAVRGPHPLVVFAHGFDVTPGDYAPLLTHIAAAGYVVAAPEFPISASGLPGAPREDDLANQALDIRATISTMIVASRRGGWLSGSLAANEVAVMGHSDGGETVAANILVSTDHDARIRAAVIVAGQLPTWGVVEPVAVPSLVVQGSADTVNPPALSQALYRRLVGPKWYLDVLGASHVQTAAGADARATTERRAIVAYLDAILRHDRRALTRLRRFGNEPGMTRLTTGSGR